MNPKPKTNFCCITPDRGDRPEFLKHCKMQIERQTIRPGDHFIVNYKPKNNEPDLIRRIQIGIDCAKIRGYDIVFIIENDDYYPNNYIENMLNAFSTVPEIEAVGVFETLYYHIIEQKYKLHKHPERSSLFCTAFKISALDGFQWPDPKNINLDLALWSHFKRFACLTLRTDNIPIGIKHGVGLCGGNGHNPNTKYYDNHDIGFEKLSKLVRPESLQFYKELSKQLEVNSYK